MVSSRTKRRLSARAAAVGVTVVTAVLAMLAGFMPPAPAAVIDKCIYPARVLDLTNWKLQLPVGTAGVPVEIKQPQLANYVAPPYFKVVHRCSGVQFEAPVNGVRRSTYPRTELRETNGTANASWSSSQGTHTMVINQAITALPAGKPHLVAGQIHDALHDISVFRLEGTRLYITAGDVTKHKLVTSDYRLGTRFEAKFVVANDQIEAYYNGVLQTTIPAVFAGAYFKAGAYPQANCTNSAPCDSTNVGQVVIYGLTVTHS